MTGWARTFIEPRQTLQVPHGPTIHPHVTVYALKTAGRMLARGVHISLLILYLQTNWNPYSGLFIYIYVYLSIFVYLFTYFFICLFIYVFNSFTCFFILSKQAPAHAQGANLRSWQVPDFIAASLALLRKFNMAIAGSWRPLWYFGITNWRLQESYASIVEQWLRPCFWGKKGQKQRTVKYVQSFEKEGAVSLHVGLNGMIRICQICLKVATGIYERSKNIGGPRTPPPARSFACNGSPLHFIRRDGHILRKWAPKLTCVWQSSCRCLKVPAHTLHWSIITTNNNYAQNSSSIVFHSEISQVLQDILQCCQVH